MGKLLNKIFCGNSVSVLKKLPSDFVDCVVTSPPYWALRDYGLKPEIWDGDIACDHEWIAEKKIISIGSSSKSTLRNGKGRDRSEKYVSASKETETNFCLKCGAWRGSLGLEPTFDLFIKHLRDIFDEIKRVLKEEGTCWVNLGDTYSGSCQGAGKNTKERVEGKKTENLGSNKNYLLKYGHTLTTKPPSSKTSVADKCLCLIPFRFAIEMINRGWILRNVVIWHKPNCMPSSVKDRFTVDFEYLFFFVKNKKYWFEMQHEPLKEATFKRIKYPFNKNKGDIASAIKTSGIKTFQKKVLNKERLHRNKRCIWTITTKPYKESHFAVFPPQLVENPIMAGCPEFVCKKCGKARQKIWDIRYEPYKTGAKSQVKTKPNETGNLIQGATRPQQMKYGRANKIVNHVGYTDCGCNAGFRPGIVLDPFSGSGTTLAVAKALGRSYIGIDLNPEYIKMAQRRIAKLNENKNT